MRRLLPFLLLAFTVSVIPASAQAVRTPPRDTSAAAPKGTGVIRGQVTSADSGRPLRRARIMVEGIGLGPEARRAVSSGLDGTYTARDLPAGRYRVRVTRGGYLSLEYGQRRPGEQGRPLQVDQGQTLTKIDFSLPRMSGIAGRVIDDAGEPIEGVSVFALRSMFYEGKRRLVPVNMAVQTDDEGEYRIPRLAPGSYQVVASTKETWTVADKDGRETIYGYLPTYFPGVAASSDGRRVNVGAGEYVRGIDLQLLPGRTARLSGTAVDSKGRPFSRVSLSEQVRGLGFASFNAGPSAPVAADGTFVIKDVAPGDYMLETSRTGADAAGSPEAALAEVTVDGNDIENLMLVGSNGGIVTGRVIAENGELPKISDIRIVVAPTYRQQAPPVLLGLARDRGSERVLKDDGTFTVRNVFGRARFQVTVPEGWMLKAVRHEGRDITEMPVELRSGEQLSGVEIIITNQVTEAAGQVVDARGTPVGEATVLLFSADADRWYENARAVRATRPDQQGRWQVKGVPPGDYLAVALDYMEADAWQDPEYLEGLRRYGTSVSVREGTPTMVSLKIATPSR